MQCLQDLFSLGIFLQIDRQTLEPSLGMPTLEPISPFGNWKSAAGVSSLLVERDVFLNLVPRFEVESEGANIYTNVFLRIERPSIMRLKFQTSVAESPSVIGLSPKASHGLHFMPSLSQLIEATADPSTRCRGDSLRMTAFLVVVECDGCYLPCGAT